MRAWEYIYTWCRAMNHNSLMYCLTRNFVVPVYISWESFESFFWLKGQFCVSPHDMKMFVGDCVIVTEWYVCNSCFFFFFPTKFHFLSTLQNYFWNHISELNFSKKQTDLLENNKRTFWSLQKLFFHTRNSYNMKNKKRGLKKIGKVGVNLPLILMLFHMYACIDHFILVLFLW